MLVDAVLSTHVLLGPVRRWRSPHRTRGRPQVAPTPMSMCPKRHVPERSFRSLIMRADRSSTIVMAAQAATHASRCGWCDPEGDGLGVGATCGRPVWMLVDAVLATHALLGSVRRARSPHLTGGDRRSPLRQRPYAPTAVFAPIMCAADPPYVRHGRAGGHPRQSMRVVRARGVAAPVRPSAPAHPIAGGRMRVSALCYRQTSPHPFASIPTASPADPGVGGRLRGHDGAGAMSADHHRADM